MREDLSVVCFFYQKVGLVIPVFPGGHRGKAAGLASGSFLLSRSDRLGWGS